MKLIFDTSGLSRALAGDETIIRIIARSEFDEFILPLAVDAEIRYGFSLGNRTAENLEIYEAFKHEFLIKVFGPNQDTAVIYAELATWAKRHGVALSHNDLWIAAAAIELGGELLTLDQDFSALPQVRVAMV